MAEEIGGEAGEVPGAVSKAGGEAAEAAEAALAALQGVTGETGEATEREKKEVGKARNKQKVEARLEFLARMYETKKNKQAEKESTGEGEKLNGEYPD